ncbi:SDR family NAD(P)-dependent oxidoreductase [Ramlibacter sp.]|uniref:SDR family NAD(P)-dependent oxidoreductase n=1 Tax=Ramlibacter sp. TaxID=1917967 RepID=UPI002C286D17|nr:SDR family NAD(P)-dependent oxidoreductase [Ramlibacter sp.]HWI84099.1 SDR family NAD(P)-dependent oxidoreductase [Ramlibacter sp.]
MTHHLTIITGASRGMGLAMAQQLLDAGHHLLCLSRRHNDELGQRATRAGLRCEQWAVDLAQPEAAATRLEVWLAAQDGASAATVTLINNAGVLPRIAPLAAIPAAELAAALRVDLEAPMLLTSAFLRGTGQWPAARKILNISSGLGRSPMASQAAYCAAKAGMDHYTRCVALEQAAGPNGARICSLAPGVIDTDMQVQMRGAQPSEFPDQGTFLKLKEKGALTSPAEAAARVLAYLARPDFGSIPVADVRD